MKPMGPLVGSNTTKWIVIEIISLITIINITVMIMNVTIRIALLVTMVL